MTRIGNAAAICGLGAAAIVAKAQVLATPAYWDEMGWLGHAMRLADGSLVQALPGFRPAEAFLGHPPLLYVVFGVAARVFGASASTAHLVSLAFAIVGAAFTYLIGKRLFGSATGLLAAVLLFLSPMYFAQSAMFLADLPVAALAAASVYFAVSRRLWTFALAAGAMVLVKETSAAIVIAIAAYDFVLVSDRKWPLARAVALLSPLAVLGGFFTWQKIVTGHWWLIYGTAPFVASALAPTSASVVRVGSHVVEWLLWRQLRVVGSVAIVLGLLLTRERDRVWWLFASIALCAAAPFAFVAMYFLPRYLLPVLPFFYLGAAWSILSVTRSMRWRVVLGTAAIAVAIVGLLKQPFEGSSEFNMRYLDVVAAHREMADTLSRDFRDARVLTVWPHSRELQEPRFGYVSAPMHMTPLVIDDRTSLPDFDRSLAQADVVLTTLVPDTPDMRNLRDHAVAAGWRVIRHVERGSIVSELFARPRQ